MDEFKPDWVVLSQGDHNEGPDFAEECRQRNIKYIVINQLAKDGYWMPDGKGAESVFDLYTKAERCFFTCRNNIAIVEKQIGAELNNAEVHRNPYHVKYQNILPYPPVNEKYYLAYPAALTVIHKAQDILFEVLRQPKWRERPIQVNLYGQGPNEQQLRKLRKFWELNTIHFKGQVSEMEDVWRENHGMILTSKMEGVPVVLVGALLCKRMAIVTDIGGHRDFVEDGVNGFIAKAPTVELIDDALERAWEKREDWEAMGIKGAEKAKEIIPPDPVGVFVQKLINLFS